MRGWTPADRPDLVPEVDHMKANTSRELATLLGSCIEEDGAFVPGYTDPIDEVVYRATTRPRHWRVYRLRGRLMRQWHQLRLLPGARFKVANKLGLVASVAIVLTYLAGTPRQFDWANALLWPLVIAPSYMRRVWPAVVLTLAFGLFGTLHLLGVTL